MLNLNACAKTQSKLCSAAGNTRKGFGPLPAISTLGADPRHVFVRRRHPIQRASTTNNNAATIENGTMAGGLKGDYEQAYLATRAQRVSEHFPNSLGVDDFVHRLEIALYQFGFSGENSIACTNLCRDEITVVLKDKIDQVFGSSFNVNGLGGVLTSGVLGVGAGLSHSPVDVESGKERYVFFSFPHIAVSPFLAPGALYRPGRPGKSAACGALCKALADLQAEGLADNCKPPGSHEPENPEYSILKQRLARTLQQEGCNEADLKKLDLVGLTKVAERTITADLESLISKAVNPEKADYAVLTGVQIHSWGKELDDDSPNLEYVQPCTAYTVVNGRKTDIDLKSIPALTPRQTRELSGWHGARAGTDIKIPEGPAAPLATVEFPYGDRQALKERALHFRELLAQLKDIKA